MLKNTITNFLIQSKKYFNIYLGICISVFLFILFFQPFPTTYFEYENKALYIGGFGGIIFIVQMLVQFFFQHHLAREETTREAYDSLRQFLYYFSQVLLTSVGFVFYIRYVGHTIITFNIVLRVIIISLSMPISIHLKNTVASMRDKNKKLAGENRLMDSQLKQFFESYSQKFIELNSENETDNLRLKVSELIFIKSADNYVEVGFREAGEVKKKLIRNTLKNVEKQLKEFNNFIRTHRSCIVNSQYVDKLNKSYNTYWLTLNESQERIPVSRQFLVAVKELF